MTRGVPIGIVSIAGIALFAWPFIGSDLPASTPAWTLSLACIAALLLVEAGSRQLDARGLALLAAIAAIDTALRLAVVEGIGGFSPIFFLVLCAGFVFGPTYGFLAGALSILVSAIAGAGVGPWVPYQVFAVGWVGVAAGVVGRGRHAMPGWRDVALLAAVGAVMGLAVGALLDIQDWVPVYRGNPTLCWEPGIDPATAAVHFARFYLLTSLAYDTFRAAGNVIMVVALGAPVLAALSRFRARLSFEVMTKSAWTAAPGASSVLTRGAPR
jgi:energy-coupling factor transport system substrate-specific component